jgi:hypothetical protein
MLSWVRPRRPDRRWDAQPWAIRSQARPCGRDKNRVKLNIASTLVYRYHLDDDWHLFINNLSSVNSGVFASGTDNEDITTAPLR